MNYSTITQVINHLDEARAYAVNVGFDHHFISEIDHLIATAEANRNGEGVCDHCKHAVWEDGEIIDCEKEPIFDPGIPSDHKCCNGMFEAIDQSATHEGD